MAHDYDGDRVRQGVELGVMRFVLALSITGAILAMVGVLIAS
jgi:hypothetical protein